MLDRGQPHGQSFGLSHSLDKLGDAVVDGFRDILREHLCPQQACMIQHSSGRSTVYMQMEISMLPKHGLAFFFDTSLLNFGKWPFADGVAAFLPPPLPAPFLVCLPRMAGACPSPLPPLGKPRQPAVPLPWDASASTGATGAYAVIVAMLARALPPSIVLAACKDALPDRARARERETQRERETET